MICIFLVDVVFHEWRRLGDDYIHNGQHHQQQIYLFVVCGSEPEDSHEVFSSCPAFERFLHAPGESSHASFQIKVSSH